MLFAPLRPIETIVEFVIYKFSGGRWLYEMELEATEPEPDRILFIYLSICLFVCLFIVDICVVYVTFSFIYLCVSIYECIYLFNAYDLLDFQMIIIIVVFLNASQKPLLLNQN